NTFYYNGLTPQEWERARQRIVHRAEAARAQALRDLAGAVLRPLRAAAGAALATIRTLATAVAAPAGQLGRAVRAPPPARGAARARRRRASSARWMTERSRTPASTAARSIGWSTAATTRD